ncbi:MAG: MFS transporter, partial [Promethearchaeota archaeon]
MRFEVKDQLTEDDIQSGLRSFMNDALATQMMNTLTTSTFIVAFALILGASNFIIGLVAAIPLLAQLVQIPAIQLVETYRVRRAIYVYAATTSRVFLLGLVLIPFLAPFSSILIVLILILLLRAVFASISTCSWNSWMHDIVPQENLGDFFSKRMTIATILAIPLGLTTGFFIDYLNFMSPDIVLFGFSIIFLLGFFAGLIGVYFISKIAEQKIAIPS